MIFEISIPHDLPATVIAFRDRAEWQAAMERWAESRDLSAFVTHTRSCLAVTLREGGDGEGNCDCPVDWEAAAANDLHAWALVSRTDLEALAAGNWQLARHQALRVQSLARALLASNAIED